MKKLKNFISGLSACLILLGVIALPVHAESNSEVTDMDGGGMTGRMIDAHLPAEGVNRMLSSSRQANRNLQGSSGLTVATANRVGGITAVIWMPERSSDGRGLHNQNINTPLAVGRSVDTRRLNSNQSSGRITGEYSIRRVV